MSLAREALQADFDYALMTGRNVSTPANRFAASEPIWRVVQDYLATDESLCREVLNHLLRADEKGDLRARTLLDKLRERHCDFHIAVAQEERTFERNASWEQ